jgi:hypothetical protein
MDSTELKSTLEVDFFLAKTPTNPVFFETAMNRKRTPHPDALVNDAPAPSLTSIDAAVSAVDEATVRSWSPPDVVRWMQSAGFDDTVVEKFFVNDITGAILLELQADDLKELDIQSFGKRHRLMNSIEHLRQSVMLSNTDSPSLNSSTRIASACTSHDESKSPSTSDEDNQEKSSKKHHRRRHKHHPRQRNNEDLAPADSVSIVAIEQLLPKIHTCSKGENCNKWQKQQRKLARLAKDLSIDPRGGSIMITGDPGNPTTAPNLLQGPGSASPSVVASSDLLGPGQAPAFRLSEDTLNEVRPRDPQENVRQFLNFQHLSRLQPVNDPATPPTGQFPSPMTDSPDSVRSTVTLSENLRTLPKLTIPTTQSEVTFADLSAQRTATPSILRRKPHFRQQSNGSAAPEHSTSGQAVSPVGCYQSPGDYYRNHDVYRQGTPFSEMDVPITAIPASPIPRDISQSIPPNMRFGGGFHHTMEPIPRSSSTNGRPPTISPIVQTLARVEESRLTPINSPTDLDTPRASGPLTNNEVTHSGPMKKRKTTRLLRHEWEDHHFTLKGTQLAMYDDAQAARRASKALEYVDVDDYAVACSSLASSSKLTAAFKKTVLKRRDIAPEDAAFAFSLIPAPSGGSSAATDKKALFNSSGKAHHFAVKTREERIDWMRELMLAKALRRGKESGETVHINGNHF